jgi:aminoglycoside phosphotransferase (APT) family kinase protein
MREQLGIRDAHLGERLGGGNSNLTQRIESAQGPLILRRPPDATISPKAAAGVRREYQVLSAIGDRARVPRVLGFCEDPAIIGAPFVVTAFVPGASITTTLPAAYPDTPATLDRIGEELIDALASVHRLDWRALGLAQFGNPERFLERQIERWLKTRAADSVRALPLITELGQWLLAHPPREAPVAIVHGDYHLDNTLFSTTEPRLAAVIDWELSTIGDPLVDLGLALMFWGARPGDPPAMPFVQGVSRRAGVVSREALAARWAAATGYSIESLAYYLCFAFWRLAAIVEGAYVLYRRGVVDSPYARALERDVPALLEEAAAVIR